MASVFWKTRGKGLEALCILALSSFIGGCYTGYMTRQMSGAPGDFTVGEEHQVNYPADQSFKLVEHVLNADGVLYDVEEPNSLQTLWRPADTKATFRQSIFGVEPRYRYRIVVTPLDGRRSKIVANLTTEAIPPDQVDKYKASTRLQLFQKIEKLAAQFPPPPTTPQYGGVNFSVLPNENLKELAARVTGNPDNWKQIAEDNGLNSPTDVAPYETVWVRATLLKPGNSEKRVPKPKRPNRTR